MIARRLLAPALLALSVGTRADVPSAPPGQACVSTLPGAEGEGGVAPFVRADVKAIAETVTCYCGCPHLQVSKCFCGTADAIRTDFAQRLDGGQTPDQVVAAYVEEHGVGILAVPPRRGFHWIIWVGPPALLVLGAAAVWLAGRRWSRSGAAPELASVPVDAAADARYREALRRAVEEP